MKNLITAVILSVPVLAAAPAIAAQGAGTWSHASAPMGQYEGGFGLPKESPMASYGCTGFSASVRFNSPQPYNGEARLVVDGVTHWTGKLSVFKAPNGKDDHYVDFRADREASDSEIAKVDQMIEVLAEGNLAQLIDADGMSLLDIPLKGSSGIRVCKLNS